MKGVRRAESVESGEKERSAAACARRKLWAHCKLLPLPLLAVSAALRSALLLLLLTLLFHISAKVSLVIKLFFNATTFPAIDGTNFN